MRLPLLLMVVGVAMTPVLLLPRAATGKLRDLISNALAIGREMNCFAAQAAISNFSFSLSDFQVG
jgi:hypothetical protein